MYTHTNIYIYIYTNVPVNAIVRPPHPHSGDSQSQETFLVSSADNQTHNYDTECSNHHPSLSILTSKGLSRSQMKRLAMYTNLPLNVIIRLPHPWSGDSQWKQTFLALFADNESRNYDAECSNYYPLLSTRRSKELNRSKMKWSARYLYVHIWIYIDIYISKLKIY